MLSHVADAPAYYENECPHGTSPNKNSGRIDKCNGAKLSRPASAGGPVTWTREHPAAKNRGGTTIAVSKKMACAPDNAIGAGESFVTV
jgi:hypothetical protein